MKNSDLFTFTITHEAFGALLFALGCGIAAAHQEGKVSMRDALHVLSADLLTQHGLQMRAIVKEVSE